MVAKKKPPPPAEPTKEAQSALQIPTGGAVAGSTIPLGTLGALGGVPSSVGGTAQGPPVFLRICVPEDQDAVLRYTTIHVYVLKLQKFPNSPFQLLLTGNTENRIGTWQTCLSTFADDAKSSTGKLTRSSRRRKRSLYHSTVLSPVLGVQPS